MKYIVRILFLCLFACLYSCDSHPTEQEVKDLFILKNQYMSSREALQKEIEWFIEPKIQCNKKNLTGRDLIHLANVLDRYLENERRKEPEYRERFKALGMPYIKSVVYYPIREMRELGADHPDKNVAVLWRLSGRFTTYSKNHKYDTKEGYVLTMRISKKDEMILLDDYMMEEYRME